MTFSWFSFCCYCLWIEAGRIQRSSFKNDYASYTDAHLLLFLKLRFLWNFRTVLGTHLFWIHNTTGEWTLTFKVLNLELWTQRTLSSLHWQSRWLTGGCFLLPSVVFRWFWAFFLVRRWEGRSCFSLTEIILIVKADMKRSMYENACSL